MGKYLSNIQLFNENKMDSNKLNKKLKKLQESREGEGAILYQLSDDQYWISIYDELIGSYEFIEGEENPYFSLRMKGIYTMVNDSDELTMVFFSGKRIIGRLFTDAIETNHSWMDKKNEFSDIDINRIIDIFKEEDIFLEDKLDKFAAVLEIEKGKLDIGNEDIESEEGYQVLHAYKPLHHKREYNKLMKEDFTPFMEKSGFTLSRIYDGQYTYTITFEDRTLTVKVDHANGVATIDFSAYIILTLMPSIDFDKYYDYFHEGKEGIEKIIKEMKLKVEKEVLPSFNHYKELHYYYPDSSYVEELNGNPEKYVLKYIEMFKKMPESINIMIEEYKILFSEIKNKDQEIKKEIMITGAVIYMKYIIKHCQVNEINYKKNDVVMDIYLGHSGGMFGYEKKYRIYLLRCMMSIYYLNDFEVLYYGLPAYEMKDFQISMNKHTLETRERLDFKL